MGKNVVRLRLACCFLLLVFLVGLVGCTTTPEGTEGGVKEEAVGEAGEKASPPDVIELRLAHFWPAAHAVETVLVPGWAKAIEEATDGQVIITSYPGETLLKAAEIYDGVVNGIAEIGISCFAYTRGRFPLSEVFELPGITYNNSKVSSMVAWEGIKELDPEEIKDTKLMMLFTTGVGNLMTKSPVQKLEDLQGMEIRATGLSAKTLEVLGALPVAMPQSDTYEALSKGVCKGNLAPNETLEGWRHAEVTDYLTITPFLYNTLFFATINLDTWNSLPPDIQSVIEEVTEKYYEEVAIGLWDTINDSGFKFAVEETGMEVINLSDEETARWMEKIQPIHDDFLTDMEGKGLPGEEALEVAKRLADKYNKIYK